MKVFIAYTYTPVNTVWFILLFVDFQNNLRTQAGNTTTVNIVVHTVDYLLRLQVTVLFMDYLFDKEILALIKLLN